jgi:hypothetical protein
MGGLLHLKYLNTLLWSPKSKGEISIRSDQWLVSYNPFARRLGGWVGGWVDGLSSQRIIPTSFFL